MSSAFLKMKNISKRYAGVQALDNVNLEIQAGEAHCLAGINGSGKSTLIKIISGVEVPDAGSEIYINGTRSLNRTSIDSIHQGIEVIYQDLSLFPNLTVAENIGISRMISGNRKILNKKEYIDIARKAMNRINIKLPLESKVENLSIADQQLVAICRALTGDLKLLIMDEPTTALTKKEVDALLNVAIDLKQKGIAIIFVSHKLNEVMDVAEKVTVLRDGIEIGCYPASELNSDKIEYLMTGGNFRYSKNEDVYSTDSPLLEVEFISKKDNYKDISFVLHPGEILGVTGLLGSGRTELAMSLFGMNPFDTGSVKLNGDAIHFKSIEEAVARGVAYVPENRLVQGLVMEQSVSKNTVVTIINRLLKSSKIIDHRKKEKLVKDLVRDFNIKIPSVDAAVSTLSGGNQQKVVLAKWIATDPKLLILDGPTVGVDVAAKGSIHEAIKELAKKGLGVIIISDEVAEVVNSCHRVLVMNRGRIISEFSTKDSQEEDILKCIEMSE